MMMIIIIIILLSFYMHIFAFPFSVPIFSPTNVIILENVYSRRKDKHPFEHMLSGRKLPK